MNERRKLPIGIQTLRIIREEGYYYVDKTAQAIALCSRGCTPMITGIGRGVIP